MSHGRPDLSLIVLLGPDESDPPAVLAAMPLPERWELVISAVQQPRWPLPAAASVITGPAGRGRQLNRAIAATEANWLWLVHADSQPDRAAWSAVARFIKRREAAIGYSWLKFTDDGPALVRLNALGANLRSRWLGLPYGDQGLCLPRSVWRDLAGFREDLVRGEDLDLVARARRSGLPIIAMGGTLTTSARRYRRQGWLRTTLAHQTAAWRLLRGANRPGDAT